MNPFSNNTDILLPLSVWYPFTYIKGRELVCTWSLGPLFLRPTKFKLHTHASSAALLQQTDMSTLSVCGRGGVETYLPSLYTPASVYPMFSLNSCTCAVPCNWSAPGNPCVQCMLNRSDSQYPSHWVILGIRWSISVSAVFRVGFVCSGILFSFFFLH